MQGTGNGSERSRWMLNLEGVKSGNGSCDSNRDVLGLVKRHFTTETVKGQVSGKRLRERQTERKGERERASERKGWAEKKESKRERDSRPR